MGAESEGGGEDKRLHGSLRVRDIRDNIIISHGKFGFGPKFFAYVIKDKTIRGTIISIR
jgi:hypothetical protein